MKEAKLSAAQQALKRLGDSSFRARFNPAAVVATADGGDEPEAALPAAMPQGPLTVNLIDCPGHVDFNSEVTSALRTCDGAVVVVDAVEGVCPQTETVLAQAIREGVYPVLFVNKVDRLLLELQMDSKDAMQRIAACIDEVNECIRRAMQDVEHELRAKHPAIAVEPWWVSGDRPVEVALHEGTVAIGSGYFRWGFTVDTLAVLYGRLDGHGERELRGRLHDPKKCLSLVRKLGIDPVLKLTAGLRKGPEAHASIVDKLARLQVRVRPQDLEAAGSSFKDAARVVLGAFLPVADCVITMMHGVLPSPMFAQAWRVPLLCAEEPMSSAAPEAAADGSISPDHGSDSSSASSDGKPESEFKAAVSAMVECNGADDAPLCFFVSKLVANPSAQGKGLLAFGRVFSGCLRADDKVAVWCIDDDGSLGVRTAQVKSVVRVMAGKVVSVREAVAGDVVAVTGLDRVLTTTGTLTQSKTVPSPLKPLRFDVEPIVHAAIRPGKPTGAQALHEAIRNLVRTDPALLTYVDDRSGDRVLVCAGELHLDVCVTWLRESTGLPLTVSDPVVPLREAVEAHEDNTVTICAGKSANKHNTVHITAAALPLEHVAALETVRGGLAAVQDLLMAECGWSKAETRRVWAVSPELQLPGQASKGNKSLDHPPSCLLVDRSVGVQHLAGIRDSVLRAFHEAVASGGLCGEPLRGVVFELRDATIHADPAHRGPVQVVPAARRAMTAAQLTSTPSIEEPVFEVTVTTPSDALGATYECLASRSAAIVDDRVSFTGDRHTVHCIMPVRTSFGFVGDLRGATSGRAFPSTRFHGWQRVPSTAAAVEVAMQVRERKGLSGPIPRPTDIADSVRTERV